MRLELVAAIIPALNESHTIREVVLKVKKYAVPIVVDDGSSDQTGVLAESVGAIVVRHNESLGYDLALQSGLFKAIDMEINYAITIDADGQHCPAMIRKFKQELISGFDVVVGVRGTHQRFSELIFSLLTNILWGIQDPLCGMKGYRLSHIKKLGIFTTYKSVGTEYVMRAARSRLTIKNIDISVFERKDKSRFGSGLIANLIIIKALIIGLSKANRF